MPHQRLSSPSTITLIFISLIRLVCLQNWLRWGLRYRLFALVPPLDHPFDVPFFGTRYRGNLNTFGDRYVYFFGAGEREYMLAMGNYVRPGSVVLDVGANVGQHSLYFAVKGAHVLAFEPYEAVRKTLEDRVRGFASVKIFDIGLSDAEGSFLFSAPIGDNIGLGSFSAGHGDPDRIALTLHTRKGDDVVRDENLTRVDFIKIDVERHEAPTLRGLQHTMHTFRPVVEFEFAAFAFSSRDEFDHLTSGYTPYFLTRNRPFLWLFNRPKAILTPFTFQGEGEVLLLPDEQAK
ncbi:MAG TPA: FkbM family methyltransferase [Candidatus Paceibacterota bacterium]|nr:FkbM family methyltransferase [Candidatus Paceibacterota bacterium]